MGGLFHKLRHPRRCYVVCTIPRSGSNLLTDGLRDTRRAGMPKQFFLPKAESRYATELGIDRAADYAAYVRAIVNTKVTRNEVFGFKLMSWYSGRFPRAAARGTQFWKFYNKRSGVVVQRFPPSLFSAHRATSQIAPGTVHGSRTSDRTLESAGGQKHSARTGVRSGSNRAVTARSRTAGENLGRFLPTDRNQTVQSGV